MNNSSKEEQGGYFYDNMDFDQPISPEFDAEEIDVFAELTGSNANKMTTQDPLQSILLEEDEQINVDPHLVAELLQVLAQHSIRQHSEKNPEFLPEQVQQVHLNSARVTLLEDDYRLSLLVELQDNQKIRPCVRAVRNSGELNLVNEERVPSVWKPLYNLLENAFKQAIQSLKTSTYFS